MTRPPFHRRIGGIHWFALGSWRVSLCRVRAKRVASQVRSKQSAILPHQAKAFKPTQVWQQPVVVKLPHTTTFPWPPESHT